MINKPPAFQFYADDFLAGTFTMSNEERGLYITLLCRQWTQGHVTKDEMERLSSGMTQPLVCHVFAKFKECQNGLFKNERMESEREKQTEFRKNRSKSGKSGANARWHSHSTAIAQPMANGMAKHGSPSPSPSPNNKSVADAPPAKRFVKPTMVEIGEYGDKISLSSQEQQKFWNHYESNGWKVGKNQMISWRASMSGWKSRLLDYSTNQQPARKMTDAEILKEAI